MYLIDPDLFIFYTNNAVGIHLNLRFLKFCIKDFTNLNKYYTSLKYKLYDYKYYILSF